LYAENCFTWDLAAAWAASRVGSSTSIFSAAALRFSEAPTATVVGCFSKVSTILITAQQSGHVIPIDQPAVAVDAIRTVVEIARRHDVLLCATLAANAPGIPPQQ
jgi:hypothetical protein